MTEIIPEARDVTPYTPGTREIFKLSKAEASRLGHDYRGPEHYLLGMIRKGEGLAIDALQNLHIDLQVLKSKAEERLGPGDESVTDSSYPLNRDAEKFIVTSKNISDSMKHGWVGTEHLILALMKEETIVSDYLGEIKISYEDMRKEVLNIVEGTHYIGKPIEIARYRKQESYSRRLLQDHIIRGKSIEEIAQETHLSKNELEADIATVKEKIERDPIAYLYAIDAYDGITDNDFKSE